MSKTYGIPSDSLLWTCHFFLRYIFSNFGTKLWHVLSYVCPLLVKLFSQNFKGPKIHLLHSYSKPGPAEPGFRCVSPHNYYGCTFWVYIQCTRYLVEVHFSLSVPCGMRWEQCEHGREGTIFSFYNWIKKIKTKYLENRLSKLRIIFTFELSSREELQNYMPC
jgi:hypothetical protein